MLLWLSDPIRRGISYDAITPIATFANLSYTDIRVVSFAVTSSSHVASRFCPVRQHTKGALSCSSSTSPARWP